MLEYKVVLEAEYFDAGLFEKHVAFLIIEHLLFFEVSRTVQLDGEFFGRTVKVEDIIAKTMLPPEFSALKFFAFQLGPEPRFRRCKVIPELGPECFQIRQVIQPQLASLISLHNTHIVKYK